MKNTRTLLFALVAFSMGSCVAPRFYQEYKVTPGKEINAASKELTYENDQVRITYDFWGEGGDAGFLLTNKTGQDIVIRKDECFFVLNGIAYDYYRGRILTTGSTTGRTASAVAQSGVSGRVRGSSAHWSTTSEESFQEQRELIVPAGTARRVAEYNVNREVFRSCDLLRFPSVRKNPSKTFAEANSPFRFANIIVYSVQGSEEKYRVRNDFHVSAITNYNARAFAKTMEEEFCGKKTGKLVTAYPMAGPGKFYIEYYRISSSTGKY